MKSVFEMAEVPLANPFENKVAIIPNPLSDPAPGGFQVCSLLLKCPHCNHGFRVLAESDEKKSFADALSMNLVSTNWSKSGAADLPTIWVKKITPDPIPARNNFEIQKLKSGDASKKAEPKLKPKYSWFEKEKWVNQAGPGGARKKVVSPKKRSPMVLWKGRSKKINLTRAPDPNIKISSSTQMSPLSAVSIVPAEVECASRVDEPLIEQKNKDMAVGLLQHVSRDLTPGKRLDPFLNN